MDVKGILYHQFEKAICFLTNHFKKNLNIEKLLGSTREVRIDWVRAVSINWIHESKEEAVVHEIIF